MNNFGLILAGIFVLAIIAVQIISFIKTKSLIKNVRNFFPQVSDIKCQPTMVDKSILNDDTELKKFIDNPPSVATILQEKIEEGGFDPNDYYEVSLIVLSNKKFSVSKYFKDVLYGINSYLCKNVGTSADFEQLKSICESRVDSLQSTIHNSLNVPLFLGLGGTFIGIIIGLLGIDFKEIFATIINTQNAVNLSGLQHLLWGVIAAMCASFIGLGLTIWNSAIELKKANQKIDDKRERYYNFLRRELMPVLSNSMASNLVSLRGELLKDLSEDFKVFKLYQTELNNTIKSLATTTEKIDNLFEQFSTMRTGLDVVVANQNQSSELQKTFQTAIEEHFPKGSEAREMWRKEFDILIEDAKVASDSLSEQLTACTQYVRNFTSDNKEFYESFGKLREVISVLVSYADVQSQCYRDLKYEMLAMRNDFKDAQKQSAETNKVILEAIKVMTKAIKEQK